MDHSTNRNAQIGNICVHWSSIEYQAAIAIWTLAGIVEPDIGKVLTASLDLKARITMAFKLAHIINAGPVFKKSIKALQTALQSENLYHRRNQAVHGIHFEVDRPDAVGVEMHRGPGGREQRIQTDSELHQLGERLNELRMEQFKALLKLINKVHPQAVANLDSFIAAEAMVTNKASTKDSDDK